MSAVPGHRIREAVTSHAARHRPESEQHMGYEYRLTFAGADPAKVRHAIGQLPGVEDADARDGDAGATAALARPMPDAVFWCTADGLSFCANTSEGLRCLGTVIARLTSTFGTVEVAELE
ncbi:hypothetical protein [uncultured Xanthomonas sp.]|uniref:hypothetical protein n=1 Tax=uncultured Xanthomonas sp. TaxID=152831 RepID=UPI0025E340DC|nr:hypothetical protein [uncultured Xanthomonas sp.]